MEQKGGVEAIATQMEAVTLNGVAAHDGAGARGIHQNHSNGVDAADGHPHFAYRGNGAPDYVTHAKQSDAVGSMVALRLGGNRQPAATRVQAYKITMCKYYEEGRCERGPECTPLCPLFMPLGTRCADNRALRRIRCLAQLFASGISPQE
jgi:hypothetical protein